MSYKKSICIEYKLGQDYYLEIIFSRHFSPKNLRKIKFVNQQLREKSRNYSISVDIYTIRYSLFNSELINKILNGVQCNLEINSSISDLKLFPRTALVQTVELACFRGSHEYLLDQIEKILNLGFRELLVTADEENREKIKAYFSETNFTIQSISPLTIKIER